MPVCWGGSSLPHSRLRNGINDGQEHSPISSILENPHIQCAMVQIERFSEEEEEEGEGGGGGGGA